MHGDFTRWTFDELLNWNGILHQQGRVLLDKDTNDQTRLVTRWQDEAARAAFGSHVAAVAAAHRDSFQVIAAEVVDGKVQLDVKPGRIWADGLLAYLRLDVADGSTDKHRVATLLGPPFQELPIDPAIGTVGTRDAVVLELWREALNGFQVKAQLIEPALGGPDTAERLITAFAFRLLRLKEGESCDDVANRIQEDLSDGHGRLTVTLAPAEETDDECPTVEAGGYTGLEHHLFRIEVAKIAEDNGPMFKWSRFNGGLVGSGVFSTTEVVVHGNRQAILRAGLEGEFYLEAVEPRPLRGGDHELEAALGEYWEVVYGARAALDKDGKIQLDDVVLFGTVPTSNLPCFFRLWNGIEPISAYGTGMAEPKILVDGIRLELTTGPSETYHPGDYWTFPVRAGSVDDGQTLLENAPPEGVRRVRVPLALLRWDGLDPITAQAGQIDDCRRVFQPLTRLSTCCTLRVGDGVRSHGDFDSIQQAVAALGEGGGQICVLPGVHKITDGGERISILDRENISITGCGERSRIVSEIPEPVITIDGCENIRIESLVIEAHEDGRGVFVQSSRDVQLLRLTARCTTRAAIFIDEGTRIIIRGNTVRMRDRESVKAEETAVVIRARDALIEENLITVELRPSETTLDQALGGLWLRGGCDTVRVINNWIRDGLGNGITLGDLREQESQARDTRFRGGFIRWDRIYTAPCGAGSPGTANITLAGDDGVGGPTLVAGDPLVDIHIERNRIHDMGLGGISALGFFREDEQARDGVISIDELVIIENEIRGCLQRPLERTPDEMQERMGYGGIALADVSGLIIRDNLIEGNGPDHMLPICGVYVFSGEGIEISRNRVINNGARTDQDPRGADPGARSGLYIQHVVAPLVDVPSPPSNDDVVAVSPLQCIGGIPALKVHDNIVSQPVGCALFAIGMGPMSILGNQFTSHGIGPESSSVLAATVAITNLGVTGELYGRRSSVNDTRWGKVTLFRGGAWRGVRAPGAAHGIDAAAAAAPMYTELIRTLDRTAGANLSKAIPNGNVLFVGNQCYLDLLDSKTEVVLASVLIISLDDVGFQDNQCDCATAGEDLVLTDVLLFGVTLRMIGNRLEDPGAVFSGITIGLINTTTNNQASHCLLTMGTEVIKAHNVEIAAATGKIQCGGFDRITKNLFTLKR